jgi:hypothetical protein
MKLARRCPGQSRWPEQALRPIPHTRPRIDSHAMSDTARAQCTLEAGSSKIDNGHPLPNASYISLYAESSGRVRRKAKKPDLRASEAYLSS